MSFICVFEYIETAWLIPSHSVHECKIAFVFGRILSRSDHQIPTLQISESRCSHRFCCVCLVFTLCRCKIYSNLIKFQRFFFQNFCVLHNFSNQLMFLQRFLMPPCCFSNPKLSHVLKLTYSIGRDEVEEEETFNSVVLILIKFPWIEIPCSVLAAAATATFVPAKWANKRRREKTKRKMKQRTLLSVWKMQNFYLIID